MLVILKIPMVYLAVVVWWAIRAEPQLGGGGSENARAFVPLTPCDWNEGRRRRPPRRFGPRPHTPGTRPVARRARVRPTA